MSVYKGRCGKGARQRRRDERYYAAVGRQMLMHDRGYYVAPSELGVPARFSPAPVEGFLRPGDTVYSVNFRSWAVS